MAPDFGFFNYWVVVILMMIGFYVVISSTSLVKKIMGLNVFQTSVFLLYISIAKVSGGSAPILDDTITTYANPLPHVLILTAIVVGVATTALGLALIVRIHNAYGTTNETDIGVADNGASDEQAAPLHTITDKHDDANNSTNRSKSETKQGPKS